MSSSQGRRNSGAKPAKKNHTGTSNGNTHKWVRDLRTLPSDPSSKDFLKLEYIDVNLNNSRKLITNIHGLRAESEEYVKSIESHTRGRMEMLNHVARELDWLDEHKSQ
ncbi:uncharacterized protein LODBEIA_P24260 [Lodderomyces beijingensis]|uniref:Uncharacterized protein n=1 Tax=Lodderomyces beijingensis TaxID=1775926 RepID=A0ABP0ZJ86_9ASCO